MKVELRPLSEIKPYPNNPRVNDDAVAAVAASLREFGFRQPIVVDADGVIICGHTRYKAALKLGLEKAPVHVAKDLSPEQIKAYRIADNQTASLADWDYDLLPIELGELQTANYDLGLLGFDQDELAKLLSGELQEGLTDPDDVPAPPDEAITQPGDLWILGEHRLLCGDSSKPEDVDRLLDGAVIHLVNTDPPYNVRLEPRSNNAIAAGLSSFSNDAAAKKLKAGQGNAAFDIARGKIKVPGTMHHQGLDLARHPEKSKPTGKKLRAKDRPLANDFVTDGEFDRLLDAWFGNLSRVLLPGRSFYVWGGYANLGNYPPFLKKHGLYFSQGIVWDKQHPVLTRKDFMGCFELCQPPDTRVLTPSGTTSLGALHDNDRVVSYSRHNNLVLGLREGFAVRKGERDYDGPLYGVRVGAHETWTTEGHIWSVRTTPAAKDKWCVYLMCDRNRWRVGRTKFFTTWGLGLKQRLGKEGGEFAWVLQVCNSRVYSSTLEQIVSVQYGIPTTFWTPARSTLRTRSMIDQIYDALDLDQMERSARACLAAFGRNVHYPFVAYSQTRHKYSHRVSMLQRSCNLLPEVMAVPVPTGGMAVEWRPIASIDVQPYRGRVHSLEVDKYSHYLADGIVTHNCFYGWKEGAGHDFFGPNNALDLWHVKKVNPQNMVHLTEKPVELATRAMQFSSRAGENVIDLFGGSGSTLIAAEQTGRRAFLMELDPLYCDVICERWYKFTGKEAIRVDSQGNQTPRSSLFAGQA